MYQQMQTITPSGRMATLQNGHPVSVLRIRTYARVVSFLRLHSLSRVAHTISCDFLISILPESGTEMKSTFSPQSAVQSSKMSPRSQREATSKPKNRNVYESIGGQPAAGGGGGSVKGKTVVNRNVYEEIGGKAQSAVVNKSEYEMIGAKPSVSPGYVMLDKVDLAAGSKMTSALVSEAQTPSSSVKRHRHRRRMKEKPKWFSGPTKTVVIFCTLQLIILLFVLAMLGVGGFLIAESQSDLKPVRRLRANRTTRPKPTETTSPIGFIAYGYNVCKKEFRGEWYYGAAGKEYCVIALPPDPSADECNKLMCQGNFFVASAEGANNTHLIDPSNVSCMNTMAKPVEIEKKSFCRTKEDEAASAKTMVCVDGRCVGEYRGKEPALTEEEFVGKWEDNCDEPSPCWNTEPLYNGYRFFVRNHEEFFNRSRCVNAPKVEKCIFPGGPGEWYSGNTVWLQHLHCEMNSGQVGTYCSGLPLRMWQCNTCDHRDKLWHRLKADIKENKVDARMCDWSKGETFEDYLECTYLCKGKNGSRLVPFNPGTPCESKEYGYCAFGMCFNVEEAYRFNRGSDVAEKLQNVGDCQAAKKERKAKRESRVWNETDRVL